MPDRFIEIAEETGAILPIGRWVLRQACREAARWLEAGSARPTRSSASTSRPARSSSSGSSTRSRPSSASPGSTPTRLVLEITETALLKATPDHGRDPPRRPGARRSDRHRRLRDRLLLAQPPPPVPGRRPEDRDRVRPGHRSRLEVVGARRRHRGHGPVARHRDGRRGDRDRRTGRPDARPRLPVRPGLPLRPAHARGPAARRLRDRLDGPAAVKATTSGRREANGRAANASRRPATPKAATEAKARASRQLSGAPSRELVVAVLDWGRATEAARPVVVICCRSGWWSDRLGRPG